MKTLKNKFKYTIYMLLMISLVGCESEENVKNTIRWVNKAKKPISVRLHEVNGFTLEKRYTLIDNKGHIYNTGFVNLSLPSKIESH